MKRLLSWLLVLTMLVACLPMSVIPALAVETDVDTSEGSDLELPFDELLPTEPEFGTAENPLELVEGENEFTVIPGTIFHATYPNNGKTYIMTVTGSDSFIATQFMRNNGSGDAENPVELTLNNEYAMAMGFGLTFESTAEVESVDLVVTLTEKVINPGEDASNPIVVSVSKAAPLSATANITAVGASVYYAVTFVDAGYVKFEATNAAFGIDYENGDTLTVAVEAGQTKTLVVGNGEWKAEAVAFTATYLTDAEIADIAAAEAVTAQINALTDLDMDTWETILAEGVDAAQVAEARAAYEALSDGAKALVEDYIVNKLALAEELTKPACNHDAIANGGKCEICGKFKLTGTTATLGNALAINFVVTMANMDSSDTGHYAVITKEYADGTADAVVTVPQSEWINYGSAARKYFTFDGIRAKEMTDTLTVVIYNSKDEAVSIDWIDSMRDYGMRALGNEEKKASPDAEKLALYVDMLNYGAAAQVYFENYHADDYANSQVSSAQQAYATGDVTLSQDAYYKGNGQMGATLTLASNIVLNFVYRNTTVDNTMYAVATYTDHNGVEQEITIEGSKFVAYGSSGWVVPLETLKIADLNTKVTLTVYSADGQEVTYSTDSIAAYLARVASNDLYVAIAKFATSAYNSFH